MASTDGTSGEGKRGGGRKFQAPKGTRDFYPEDQLRRRYITETWRAVSLRHGFEEIDGPTFEHLDLYTVKSGEGIVSELFSFQRQGGDDTYALRPEFTPTLARMYAARAAQLPKPVRWFCVPSFFRAERPQRGRLREFQQWNCDVIGGGGPGAENAEADGELLAVSAGGLSSFGLFFTDVSIRISDRRVAEAWFRRRGIDNSEVHLWLALVDGYGKHSHEQLSHLLQKMGADVDTGHKLLAEFVINMPLHMQPGATGDSANPGAREINSIARQTSIQGLGSWCQYDGSIVRGLAYYTGMVFEVIAEGERAVAGGGRYDNLIELLGGPPTPAVGFAMGDVVLANLLEDKGLMPSAAELAGAVEAVVRSHRLRPEVFMVSGGEEDDAHVVPLVARLRRGIEAEGFAGKPWDAARYAVRPLHVRSSDKATRNTKKLLQDAVKQGSRLFCEIHGADKVELKDLDTQAAVDPPKGHASFSIDPGAPNYVGRAVVGVLG